MLRLFPLDLRHHLLLSAATMVGSAVVALIFFAIAPSRSAWIILPFPATMNHDGLHDALRDLRGTNGLRALCQDDRMSPPAKIGEVVSTLARRMPKDQRWMPIFRLLR